MHPISVLPARGRGLGELLTTGVAEEKRGDGPENPAVYLGRVYRIEIYQKRERPYLSQQCEVRQLTKYLGPVCHGKHGYHYTELWSV